MVFVGLFRTQLHQFLIYVIPSILRILEFLLCILIFNSSIIISFLMLSSLEHLIIGLKNFNSQYYYKLFFQITKLNNSALLLSTGERVNVN